MQFRGCGSIRRSRGRPSPHGIRGGIGQLLNKEKYVNQLFLGKWCTNNSNSPCRMTHIGGRSTFSPAIVSSDLKDKTQSKHTPCSPQQQIVLQRLKLFLHCVGGLCKWDGGGKWDYKKVLRVLRPAIIGKHFGAATHFLTRFLSEVSFY